MTIDLNVHNAQHEFLTSSAVHTGLVAGLGSGKSFIATLKTIMKKLEFPERKVAYYLPTYPLIRDIAFDKFPEMLDILQIPYKLNKSDKEIHIKGASCIIFRSMSDPQSIVGYETAYSLIDEVDILPQETMQIAFDKILARNRSKVFDNDGNEQLNQLDVVGTPEGFKFFYKRFVTEIGEDDRLIRAKTYDNKHLPAQYIANLERQYTPELLKAYLEGEFVNLRSGTIYSYFDRLKHHAKTKVEDYEIIRVSMDFNVGGCAMTHSVLRDGKLRIYKEGAPHDTLSAIHILKNLYPEQRVIIYPDASGRQRSTNASRSDIDLLEEAGFEIEAKKSNPAVEDRINTMNLAFYKEQIVIDTDTCPQLAKALEQQAYDDQGRPEKFGGSATIDDFNDSLGYKVYRLFALSAPKVSVTNRRLI